MAHPALVPLECFAVVDGFMATRARDLFGYKDTGARPGRADDETGASPADTLDGAAA